MFPLSITKNHYLRSKGNHVRFVKCPDYHCIYSDIYPIKMRQRQELASTWIRYFCSPHADYRQSIHSLGGGCRDGIAAVFHFPESTHPSKNLNASLIHNTLHKDFIFPAHSDTLWRQSVLPLKSLLSRKIWSFDIQEITVICKTRLICQG